MSEWDEVAEQRQRLQLNRQLLDAAKEDPEALTDAIFELAETRGISRAELVAYMAGVLSSGNPK